MKIIGQSAQSIFAFPENTLTSPIHSQSNPRTFHSFSERLSYSPPGTRPKSDTPQRYQALESKNRSSFSPIVIRQRRANSSIENKDRILFPRSSITAPAVASPPSISSHLAPSADRATNLFTRNYADIFKCTLDQAATTLREADDTLYRSWRDLKDIEEVRWTPADADSPRSAHDLAYSASLFSGYLRAHPATDDAMALAVARAYLTFAPITVIEHPALADLYRGVLQRHLHWIDLDKVKAMRLSAAQILQAVCRYRQPKLGSREAFAARLQHPRDVIADEAALIAFYTQSNPVVIEHGAPMHVIRARYAGALIDEWQDAAIGLTLLPSAPIAPVQAKFWYSGAFLQNGRGKNIEQIVSTLFDGAPYAEERSAMRRMINSANRRRYLPGQPAAIISATSRSALLVSMHGMASAVTRYAQRPGAILVAGVWLTRDELYAIVDKTMRDLLLDTAYPIGTPQHAIATVLLRYGPKHGENFDAFNNPAALMAAFNRLEQAWQYHPRSVASPSLCAALYLAQTSDVLFLRSDSPLI